jgi:hypothetical protein
MTTKHPPPYCMSLTAKPVSTTNTQPFHITIDWNIKYNNDSCDKELAFNTIIEKLNLIKKDHFKNDICAPWYKTLEDIYNSKTNNYDGYIKDVQIKEDINIDNLDNIHKIHTFYISAYLLHDAKKIKDILVLQPSNKELIKLIEKAFYKQVSLFNYTVDDKVLAEMNIFKIAVEEYDPNKDYKHKTIKYVDELDQKMSK